MVALVRTLECFPDDAASDSPFGRALGLSTSAGEPDHERCVGGQTIDGILGGWRCPCPCHHNDDRRPTDG